MKVVLGADVVRYPVTGIARYAYELGRRLPAAGGIEEMHYFRGGRIRQELPERPHKGHAAQAGTGLRRLAGSMPLVADALRQVAALVQARALRPYRDYLFHGPNFYLPRHAGPCVSTFHDLSALLWPECHPAARVRHMAQELPKLARRADVLITDSEFTRREVAAYFNLSLDRIIVTPLAASCAYQPMTEAEAGPVLSALQLRFGAYALFVGTLDPRKNIDLLLDLYERMPDAERQRTPLVVAGFEGWKSAQTIARLQAGTRAGWARYFGFVEESALPALYAGARVFLYPSRYEGFGLPVLEAMAAGVPVICSDAASLPEVTGDSGAAVLLPADDTDAFYQALLRALGDDAWCAKAGAAGVERASQFSWNKTVAATLGAYRLALQ